MFRPNYVSPRMSLTVPRCAVQIDTHVHHSACMHQKHLLRFIKSKLKREADEIVIFRDGKFLTLQARFLYLCCTFLSMSPRK